MRTLLRPCSLVLSLFFVAAASVACEVDGDDPNLSECRGESCERSGGAPARGAGPAPGEPAGDTPRDTPGSSPTGPEGTPSPSPTDGRGPSAAFTGNPYIGASLFVNPDYQAKVDTSIARAPGDAALLRKAREVSTALWLDRIAKLSALKPTLDRARADQDRLGKPVVSTLVVYDLPDRDCAANASAGELDSERGGLERYKTAFIDAIAAELKARPNQRVSIVLEPDSLPNLVTNLNVPKCVKAAPVYREAVAYAIAKLSMPNVAIYVDAAHSGWLGWEDNTRKAAAIFKEVLDAAGGPDKIRGFITNVSNYTPLSVSGGDPHPPEYYESNPCRDELTFVQRLSGALTAVGVTGKGFLIDTSRNGVVGTRTKWGNWCNIRGAGMGERPRATPAPGVDAYVWVKAPGESDGVADPAAPRYDASCNSIDSVAGAPQAGEWFHEYFVALAKNAVPAL